MIKLLKHLAENLGKEDLYNLAVFLSDNPDIIDQETLLHIIHEVNDFENTTITVELDGKLEEIKVRLSEQQNLSEEDVIEWQQLCDWLKKDNFSFFGYCSFSRKKSVSDQAFELQKSSGLGIFKQ